jgi:hypothetical protein
VIPGLARERQGRRRGTGLILLFLLSAGQPHVQNRVATRLWTAVATHLWTMGTRHRCINARSSPCGLRRLRPPDVWRLSTFLAGRGCPLKRLVHLIISLRAARLRSHPHLIDFEHAVVHPNRVLPACDPRAMWLLSTCLGGRGCPAKAGGAAPPWLAFPGGKLPYSRDAFTQ